MLPAGGSGYGLHPSLINVQRLFNQQHAALVFNVGTLVRPTTKATLNNTTLPKNLYSHSDQVQQWQTSDPNGGGTGWGGRINDLASALNTGPLPSGITVNGGNSLFLSGPITKGLNFSNADSFGFNPFGDSTAMAARLGSLQKLLTFDSGLKLVSAANGVLGESIKSAQEIEGALERRAGAAGRVPELGSRPAARAGRADHRRARFARHEPADLLRRHGRVRQSRKPARQSRAADDDDRRRHQRVP